VPASRIAALAHVAAGVLVVAAVVLYFLRPATTPPGFFVDEPSVTLNAACLDAAGTDEYGAHMPLWFRAFGEYKLPVYIYLQAALFRVIPPSLMAARILSMLLGLAAVGVLIALARRRDFGAPTREPLFGAVAAFVCLLSPWVLVIARFPVEVTLVPLVVALQLVCAESLLRRPALRWAIADGIAVGIGVYVYHPLKIVPLIHFAFVGIAALVRIRRDRTLALSAAVAALVAIVIMEPFIADLFGSRTSLARFHAVGAHVGPASMLRLFFLHFNPRFLFFHGDSNLRHHYGGPFGMLNIIFLPLGIAGAFECVRRVRRGDLFAGYLPLLVLACFVPASVTDDGAPHALRTSIAFMPIALMSVYGAVLVWNLRARAARAAVIALVVVALGQAVLGVVRYQTVYRRQSAGSWLGYDYLARLRQAPANVPLDAHNAGTVFSRLFLVIDRHDLRYCH
jgi:4-amino-4-deoxy-L-arabinose transferase-like glycosyltransferase